MSTPPDPDKSELLAQIRDEREKLEALLAGLSPERMLQPGADGGWNVKDVLAHIVTWEGWMQEWTASLVRGAAPKVPEPWDIDRMNAEAYARVRDLALVEVQAQFRRSYRDSLALVESLSEAQLQTEYADTWPQGRLWTRVAANMNWHYREHRKDIEKWLAQA
jgi:uncharacterized protein (TIGR03083 family)